MKNNERDNETIRVKSRGTMCTEKEVELEIRAERAKSRRIQNEIQSRMPKFDWPTD